MISKIGATALAGASVIALAASLASVPAYALDVGDGAYPDPIDGAVDVHKTGSGTTTFTATNTYTGSTSIDGGGTLALSGGGSIASSSGVQVGGTFDISGTIGGASIKDLTGSGTVALGDRTLTISDASGSFSGVIGGTGGLTIAGGTQTLGWINTYTGATTIDSGATLALGDQGRIAKSSGVEVNGTLDLTNSSSTQIKSLSGSGTVQLGQSLIITDASGTFSGAIHGATGISVNNGTQVLSGDNDFSGGAGIGGDATLQIGDGGTSGSITSDVTNYGTLAFNRSDELTYAGAITGPGSVTVSGGGKIILTGESSGGASTSIAADTTLQIGNGGAAGYIAGVDGAIDVKGTLVSNRSDAVQWYGALSGSGGFEQAGSGSLTLRGDNSGFTGTTTVSAGALVVRGGGLGGDVEVKSGGSLSGDGVIAGSVTIRQGGTYSAGTSVGKQTVLGNYTNNGTFEVGASPIAGDRLTVGGTVDITGATLKLALAPNNAASWNVLNGPYKIIDNQGSAAVVGQFNDNVLNNLLFLDNIVDYQGGDGNDVTLSLIRNDIEVADIAQTGNQQATAHAIDQLGTGNPLALSILLLDDEETARLALNAVSGEAHASIKGMFLQDSHFLMDAATTRIRSALDRVSTASLPVMAYGEGGPEAVAADTDRFAVWGQGFGSWANIDGDGNAAGFERSTGGFLVGADGAIGDTWRLGLLTGYSRSSFDVEDRASSGSSDNYHLGVYGGGQWGAFGLRGGANYSWHRIQTGRTVDFPGFGDQLSATYDAGTAQVYGEAAYRIDTARAAFEPFANLAYVNLHTDGFSEEGGAAALTAAGSNTNLTFSTLGVRASTDFTLGSIPAAARGTLGWRHAYGAVTPTSQVAFDGSDAFSVAGTPIARDALVVEAGIDLTMSPAATLGLTYSGQFGSGSSDNGFKARLGLEF